MFAIYLILSIFGVFVLQSTIIPLVSPTSLRPDLALLASIYFGLYWGEKKGVWIGFLFGIVEDSLTLGPLGLNALIKSFMGFSAGYLRHNIAASNLFPQAILVFAASFMDSLVVNLGRWLLSLGSVSWKGYFSAAPLFAAVNCIAGLIMFRIMRKAETHWRLKDVGGTSI